MLHSLLRHRALHSETKKPSIVKSEDGKKKCYVIVISCAEAFLSLVLTRFIIMLIILMEPIIRY